MATDDLGSMLVSFEADLSGLLTGQQQFISSFDSMMSTADNFSSSLTSLAPLDAGKLIEDVSGAENEMLGIEHAAISMDDELTSLAPLDAGKLVVGAGEAEQELEQVGAKAEQASQKVKEIGSSSGGGFSGMLSSISTSATGFMDFVGKAGLAGMALQGFGQTIQGVGNFLIGSNASMEQTSVAFKQLLGSSSAADTELKSIAKLAADTPFEFPDLANSVQKLLAFQIPLKDTHPLLIAIGDALSGLGKNTPATLDQVVSVFGQMNAAGKLQTQDLMQLTSVGINGFQLLADQMGKPVSVIKDMVTKGTIPAKDGIEALRAGMEKTFGGGMQAQATTFNGLLSTFQDNAGAALRAFSGPLFDMAKGGLTDLGNLVSSKSFQDFAGDLGKRIGNALKDIGNFANNDVVPAVKNILTYLNSDQFAGVLADFQTLGYQLGRDIGPALSNLAPLAKDFLSNIGPVLTNDIIPAIDTFVFDLGQVVMYFNENHDAAQLLGDVLLGVGAAFAAIQIGTFLATVPALAVGFLTWASAAGAAALATLAATWPILAIGLGIGLVVAGILLAVQHWGEISKWLTDRWSDVSGFFTGIWKNVQNVFGNIGKWFQDRFTDAKNGIGNGLKGAGDGVKNAGKSIEDNWNQTTKNIVDGGKWLYDHNTYVKKSVDDSVKNFDDLKKNLGKTWDDISKKFDDAGKGIQKSTESTGKSLSDNWTNVSNFVGDKFSWIGGKATEASNFVGVQWQKGVDFVTGQWNRFSGFVGQVWGKISSVFSSAWDTYIAGPMGKLWDRFTGWWDGLISQAGNIGGQVIQSIVDGIWSGIGNIGNAIHGAVGTALGDLGFHNIPGFAVGTDNAPGGLSVVGENGPEVVNLPRGSQVIPLQGGIRTLAATAAANSSMMNGGGETHIHNHIYLDGREMTNTLMTKATQIIRTQGGKLRSV